MSGHIEPLSGIIRIGGDYGEAYSWAATVRWLDPEKVEILGVIRPPLVSEWRDVHAVLLEWGVKEVCYWRKDGASPGWRTSRVIGAR